MAAAQREAANSATPRKAAKKEARNKRRSQCEAKDETHHSPLSSAPETIFASALTRAPTLATLSRQKPRASSSTSSPGDSSKLAKRKGSGSTVKQRLGKILGLKFR